MIDPKCMSCSFFLHTYLIRIALKSGDREIKEYIYLTVDDETR